MPNSGWRGENGVRLAVRRTLGRGLRCTGRTLSNWPVRQGVAAEVCVCCGQQNNQIEAVLCCSLVAGGLYKFAH